VKRATFEQWIVALVLVVVTVGVRVTLRDIPNFAPVAAVALFAGYYFRHAWLAALVPLTVMAISDVLLGGYQPVLMLTVYSLLAMPVLLRSFMRHSFRLEGTARAIGASLAGLLACSLICSVLFFLATNLATWYVTPWYPRTVTGLWQCYVNAIPFFRYTAAGDLAFAGMLFGGYAVLRAIAVAPSSAVAARA
jgi:hypothetical protein